MNCWAKVTGPDGKVTWARVFLDSGAAGSFITETLAQQLRLPLQRKDNSAIAGIARINVTHKHGTVSFTESHVHGRGKQIRVPHEFVLPKVTMDMPATPCGSIDKWKHLTGLVLASINYWKNVHANEGTGGRITVIIEAVITAVIIYPSFRHLANYLHLETLGYVNHVSRELT